MAKPTPEPVDPAQLADLALAVLAADRFPYLATMDSDQPRVRPVSPVRTEESPPAERAAADLAPTLVLRTVRACRRQM